MDTFHAVQLDEKEVIIGTLLQNIQNCTYNNIVVNDSFWKSQLSSWENKNDFQQIKSSWWNNDQNNNVNQKTISEIKDKPSLTLDQRIDESNPTTFGDKVTEKETKEQIIESSCHHSDKKMM